MINQLLHPSCQTVSSMVVSVHEIEQGCPDFKSTQRHIPCIGSSHSLWVYTRRSRYHLETERKMSGYSDRALSESVRRCLMQDTRLVCQPIHVSMNKGYVMLVGPVDAEENRQLVLELTEGVVGVRGIEDRLTIQ